MVALTNDEFRSWMSTHRYTVRSLAARLGVWPSTVQRYRDGSRCIPQVVGVALRALEEE